jgi:TDG/mug DNA glycosylase family protein
MAALEGGQRTAKALRMKRNSVATEKLPFLLATGLDVVFVGTAAGHRSAAEGAYYAHPGNRFWRTLHEVGLTDRRYAPHEFPALLDLRIGFTDMSKVSSGMDHEIAPEHFDVTLFETKMWRFRPRAIAFTSKKAASLWLGVPTGQIEPGRQTRTLADFPQVFVLNSPSGAATKYWDIRPWRELAAWLKTTKS